MIISCHNIVGWQVRFHQGYRICRLLRQRDRHPERSETESKWVFPLQGQNPLRKARFVCNLTNGIDQATLRGREQGTPKLT